MRKHTILLLAAVIIHLLLAGTTVLSQDTPFGNPVITTGISSVQDSNIFSAREKALADAQKKALLEVLSTLMTFEQISRQLPVLRPALFDRAADYIESYRVLHDRSIGEKYHITIQSTIAREPLQAYLISTETLAPQVSLPRILLMISQQKLRQNFSTCWWSFIDPEVDLTVIDQTVTKELEKEGFAVVDHRHMARKPTAGKVFGCLDIRPTAIQALGRQFQADIAIVGNALTELTGEPTGSRPGAVQVSIRAEAIQVEDGSVIASADSYIPASGEDEAAAEQAALIKASLTFAHQLGEEISLNWVKESAGISSSTLRVSGLSDYLDLSRFKSDLKKRIPQISNLTQKTLSETGSLIEVESPLATPALAELIEKKRFKDFTVLITLVEPPLIEMEVTLKTDLPEETSD